MRSLAPPGFGVAPILPPPRRCARRRSPQAPRLGSSRARAATRTLALEGLASGLELRPAVGRAGLLVRGRRRRAAAPLRPDHAAAGARRARGPARDGDRAD